MSLSLIDFESAQPFATRFLTQALENHQLVNTYLFKGCDLATAYKLILRLAQIINCQQAPGLAQACGQCQPCRWIAENAHPGVITLSNATFLVDVDPETGAAKTKTGKPQQSISVAQLDNLLGELRLHSGGFHRIVILTGAVEVPEALAENPFAPPKDWAPQQDGILTLLPLDRRLFPERLANKFLKTLEEPPLDVLFFLLTDSEDKLLETIVSRCQVVPLKTPPQFYTMTVPAEAQAVFADILAQPGPRLAYEHVHALQAYATAHHLSLDAVLAQFQAFTWKQGRSSVHDPQRYASLKQGLLRLSHAQRMLADNVRPDAVLEDLFVNY